MHLNLTMFSGQIKFNKSNNFKNTNDSKYNIIHFHYQSSYKMTGSDWHCSLIFHHYILIILFKLLDNHN